MANNFVKMSDFSEVRAQASVGVSEDMEFGGQDGQVMVDNGTQSWLDKYVWINDKRKVLIRAVLGEGLCTFLFIFIVCATHINHIRSREPEGMVLYAISTGFTAIALIYSFADVSGAHFNPAVTFATMVTGKTSWKKGAMYIAMQLFAAIFATVFVHLVFPRDPNLPATLDFLVVDIAGGNPGGAFFMEFILSFILVYVIFATAFDTVDTSNAVKVDAGDLAKDKSVGRNLTIYTTSGNSKAGFAPIAIGLTLGFLCLIGGTVSGGAFNPARVFGPALVANKWNNHWIYWFGDFLGAAAAGFCQSFFAHKPVQKSGNNV
ncbi:aquaporin-like protein [Paraphysoderma sedebokerense]|nr:aquaporin-like protein [Paraphysoderma sedebokerense]